MTTMNLSKQKRNSTALKWNSGVFHFATYDTRTSAWDPNLQLILQGRDQWHRLGKSTGRLTRVKDLIGLAENC